MNQYSHYIQCAQVRPGLRSWTPCRHGDRTCPRARSRTTCAGGCNAGEWEPGERLPAVAELAQHYGVARNTVIKALRRLADDGLIEIVPNWGTFRARNWKTADATAGLGMTGRVPDPDGEWIISRFALRELLDELGELTGKHQQATQPVDSPYPASYGLRLPSWGRGRASGRSDNRRARICVPTETGRGHGALGERGTDSTVPRRPEPSGELCSRRSRRADRGSGRTGRVAG